MHGSPFELGQMAAAEKAAEKAREVGEKFEQNWTELD